MFYTKLVKYVRLYFFMVGIYVTYKMKNKNNKNKNCWECILDGVWTPWTAVERCKGHGNGTENKITFSCCMKTQPTLLPNNTFSKQKQYIMGFLGKRAEKQPVKAQNQ